MKSDTYFSTVEKIINELKRSTNSKDNFEKIIVGTLREYQDDREGFYLLSNLVQINPILYGKFEKLCVNNSLDPIETQKLFVKSLRTYQSTIEDKRVRHLIDVFMRNPNYS